MKWTVEIPDGAWKPNDMLDYPRSRLRVTLVINGLPMHLEAWEVRQRDDGIQVPTAVEDNGDYESVYEGVHADGAWRTLEIAGREYVLIATPFC